MTNQEKEIVMSNFEKQVIQVLGATTVVEVGIDIKHANTIVIYGANGFGLAQLHQLRGRVGRGGQQAFCFLLTESDDTEAWNRLNYLVDHDDGFDIARFDLANRGQGDIAGVRQSGVYDFQIASIYDDLKILEVAREDAKAILQKTSRDKECQEMVDYVETVMAKTIAIVD
jgi:ATP-dependent DNA helicase RecG